MVKIQGFDNYYITNTGYVISFANSRPRKLKQKTSGNTDYAQVNLWKNNKGTTLDIHRLVAEAFLEQEPDCPVVNHKDGNKLNNRVTNLEWTTQSKNLKHAFATGICERPKGKFQKGHSRKGWNNEQTNANST